MAGNVNAAGEPYAGEVLGVLDKSGYGLGAGRPAGDAAMQAHRHHLGVRFPFGVQAVKRILQVLIEIAGTHQAAPPEAGVVGLKAVGQHQPGPVVDRYIVGQVVIGGDAVVKESPLGGHQFPGVDAGGP